MLNKKEERIKTNLEIHLVEDRVEPRSKNPTTNPIGSGRIQPADKIRSESGLGATFGTLVSDFDGAYR